MKKRLVLLLLATMTLMVGCGKDKIETDTIEIPQYKNVKVADFEMSKDILDEEVDSKLAALVEEQTVYTNVTDRPVADGDVVTIDYELKLSEVRNGFVGGPAKNVQVIVGDVYAPIYAENLIGHQVGDTITWDGYVPDDYSESLIAGMDVSYEIQITKIQTANSPKVDDSFASKVSNTANTVKDLREELKAEAEAEYSENLSAARANEAWVVVLDNSKITEYPEDRLSEKKTKILETQMAINDGEQTSAQSIVDAATIEIQAKSALKEILVAEQIAKQEGLDLSEDQIKDGLEQIRVQYGLESVDAVSETFSDQELQELLIVEMVKVWVGEHSK